MAFWISSVVNGYTLYQASSFLESVGYALLLGIFIDGIYVGLMRGLKKSRRDLMAMTGITPGKTDESSRTAQPSRESEPAWAWPPSLTPSDKSNGELLSRRHLD